VDRAIVPAQRGGREAAPSLEHAAGRSDAAGPPIATIFPAVPHVLPPVAAVFPTIRPIFRPIRDAFQTIEPPPVMPPIDSILAPIPPILGSIPTIFAPIPNILAPVADVFAPIGRPLPRSTRPLCLSRIRPENDQHADNCSPSNHGSLLLVPTRRACPSHLH